MKKLLKSVSLLLVVLTICLSFAACAKTIKGTYSADFLGTGTKLTFDGKDVKISLTVTLLGEIASMDATYEIKDDKITFDIADEDEVDNELAKAVVKALEEPQDFEEGEDYIKIGDTKYTLVED